MFHHMYFKPLVVVCLFCSHAFSATGPSCIGFPDAKVEKIEAALQIIQADPSGAKLAEKAGNLNLTYKAGTETDWYFPDEKSVYLTDQALAEPSSNLACTLVHLLAHAYYTDCFPGSTPRNSVEEEFYAYSAQLDFWNRIGTPGESEFMDNLKKISEEGKLPFWVEQNHESLLKHEMYSQLGKERLEADGILYEKPLSEDEVERYWGSIDLSMMTEKEQQQAEKSSQKPKELPEKQKQSNEKDPTKDAGRISWYVRHPLSISSNDTQFAVSEDKLKRKAEQQKKRLSKSIDQSLLNDASIILLNDPSSFPETCANTIKEALSILESERIPLFTDGLLVMTAAAPVETVDKKKNIFLAEDCFESTEVLAVHLAGAMHYIKIAMSTRRGNGTETAIEKEYYRLEDERVKADLWDKIRGDQRDPELDLLVKNYRSASVEKVRAEEEAPEDDLSAVFAEYKKVNSEKKKLVHEALELIAACPGGMELLNDVRKAEIKLSVSAASGSAVGSFKPSKKNLMITEECFESVSSLASTMAHEMIHVAQSYQEGLFEDSQYTAQDEIDAFSYEAVVLEHIRDEGEKIDLHEEIIIKLYKTGRTWQLVSSWYAGLFLPFHHHDVLLERRMPEDETETPLSGSRGILSSTIDFPAVDIAQRTFDDQKNVINGLAVYGLNDEAMNSLKKAVSILHEHSDGKELFQKAVSENVLLCRSRSVKSDYSKLTNIITISTDNFENPAVLATELMRALRCMEFDDRFSSLCSTRNLPQRFIEKKVEGNEFWMQVKDHTLNLPMNRETDMNNVYLQSYKRRSWHRLMDLSGERAPPGVILDSINEVRDGYVMRVINGFYCYNINQFDDFVLKRAMSLLAGIDEKYSALLSENVFSEEPKVSIVITAGPSWYSPLHETIYINISNMENSVILATQLAHELSNIIYIRENMSTVILPDTLQEELVCFQDQVRVWDALRGEQKHERFDLLSEMDKQGGLLAKIKTIRPDINDRAKELDFH